MDEKKEEPVNVRRLRRVKELEQELGADIARCRDDKTALDHLYEIRHTSLVMCAIKTHTGEYKGTSALTSIAERCCRMIDSINDRKIKIQVEHKDLREKRDVEDELEKIMSNPDMAENIKDFERAFLKSMTAKDSVGEA